jgi:thymidylate synthase (FAD)
MVEYITHMGSDDTVCDAARVSMDKTADMFTPSQNERLINYLARHSHWSPFSHVSIQMRFTAPIFIARQLAKHQIGFAWNEVSRRYVNSDPTFFVPRCFRDKADNVKQGSAVTENVRNKEFMESLNDVHEATFLLYKDMIDSGVCPEQARMILPQSMLTEWIWTGSLYAWSRMYRLRVDIHAQAEVQEYAYKVSAICAKKFPLSWNALTGDLV